VIVGALWILWRIVRWFLQRVRNRGAGSRSLGHRLADVAGERMIKAVYRHCALYHAWGSSWASYEQQALGGGLALERWRSAFGAQQTHREFIWRRFRCWAMKWIRVGDVAVRRPHGDGGGHRPAFNSGAHGGRENAAGDPNGTVATINVENLSRRTVLFKTALGCTWSTYGRATSHVLRKSRRFIQP